MFVIITCKNINNIEVGIINSKAVNLYSSGITWHKAINKHPRYPTHLIGFEIFDVAL